MDRPLLWQGTAVARWALPAFVGMLVVSATAIVAVALSEESPVWITIPYGLVLLASSGLVYAFRRIEVTVDAGSLRIRYALPHTSSVDLADVERVEHLADLRPTQWGGWGYRVWRGRRAVVLRRGDAIVLHRADGSRFAVTVDDAAGGVEAISRVLAGR